MGCTFCAFWRRFFPLTAMPKHDCFHDRGGLAVPPMDAAPIDITDIGPGIPPPRGAKTPDRQTGASAQERGG